MKLSADDIEGALYCVLECMDRRRRDGTPVPAWMDRLGKLFDLASLTSGGSASGHESHIAEAQSGLRLIGSVEAAHLLGQSSRQVRRLKADLDGQKIGRDWYFDYDTVIEYAKARQK